MTKQVTDEEWAYVLRMFGEHEALTLRVRGLEIAFNTVMLNTYTPGARENFVEAMYVDTQSEEPMAITLARELLEGRG